jgi:hypothetical protein
MSGDVDWEKLVSEVTTYAGLLRGVIPYALLAEQRESRLRRESANEARRFQLRMGFERAKDKKDFMLRHTRYL